MDEIEEALALGYDRIAFADDVFTLNRHRVMAICAEIKKEGSISSGSAWDGSIPWITTLRWR